MHCTLLSLFTENVLYGFRVSSELKLIWAVMFAFKMYNWFGMKVYTVYNVCVDWPSIIKMDYNIVINFMLIRALLKPYMCSISVENKRMMNNNGDKQ